MAEASAWGLVLFIPLAIGVNFWHSRRIKKLKAELDAGTGARIEHSKMTAHDWAYLREMITRGNLETLSASAVWVAWFAGFAIFTLAPDWWWSIPVVLYVGWRGMSDHHVREHLKAEANLAAFTAHWRDSE